MWGHGLRTGLAATALFAWALAPAGGLLLAPLGTGDLVVAAGLGWTIQ